MKVLAVGGGSGGHVTPVVAIYKELAKRDPQLEVEFICDKSFYEKTKGLFADLPVKIHVIAAGKLRRYPGLPWYQYLTPHHIWHTHLANLTDLFRFLWGRWQARRIIRHLRPDVVFVKGGYVGLSVGLLAHQLKIPLVLHDSDMTPGLTNRVLAKVADLIGTGMPLANYPDYPKSRTSFVGIPVNSQLFRPISQAARRRFLEQYNLSDHEPLILVTGGGGGSGFLNQLAVASAPLLGEGQILLLSGREEVERTSISNLQVTLFIHAGLTDALRVADLVVTRAGASSLAEIAAAGKPAIIVPHPHLAGQHQIKNAAVFARHKAAVVMPEDALTSAGFAEAVDHLLEHPTKLAQLGQAMHEFARPDAVAQMADLITQAGANRGK